MDFSITNNIFESYNKGEVKIETSEKNTNISCLCKCKPLLGIIFRQLDPRSVLFCRRVCKFFYAFVSNNTYWLQYFLRDAFPTLNLSQFDFTLLDHRKILRNKWNEFIELKNNIKEKSIKQKSIKNEGFVKMDVNAKMTYKNIFNTSSWLSHDDFTNHFFCSMGIFSEKYDNNKKIESKIIGNQIGYYDVINKKSKNLFINKEDQVIYKCDQFCILEQNQSKINYYQIVDFNDGKTRNYMETNNEVTVMVNSNNKIAFYEIIHEEKKEKIYIYDWKSENKEVPLCSFMREKSEFVRFVDNYLVFINDKKGFENFSIININNNKEIKIDVQEVDLNYLRDLEFQEKESCYQIRENILLSVTPTATYIRNLETGELLSRIAYEQKNWRCLFDNQSDYFLIYSEEDIHIYNIQGKLLYSLGEDAQFSKFLQPSEFDRKIELLKNYFIFYDTGEIFFLNINNGKRMSCKTWDDSDEDDFDLSMIIKDSICYLSQMSWRIKNSLTNPSGRRMIKVFDLNSGETLFENIVEQNSSVPSTNIWLYEKGVITAFISNEEKDRNSIFLYSLDVRNGKRKREENTPLSSQKK